METAATNNEQGKKSFDPLAKLTPEQLEKLQKFKTMLFGEEVPASTGDGDANGSNSSNNNSNHSTLNKYTNPNNLSEKDFAFCNDDACLLRYLRARDYNLDKSLELILGSLQWRREFKPDEITAEDVAEEAKTGKLYRFGFDKDRRPVIYMRPRRENSQNYVDQIKLLVYTIEKAIASMDPDVEQMVWLIDFNGYSTRNAPPMHVSRQTLDILSNQYPERLGLAIMVDAGWLFNMFWKAIRPFVHPVTREKIHFISGDATNPESDKCQFFAKHFDLSQLEKEYGGTNEHEYNHEVDWPKEAASDKFKKDATTI